jgi:hypothetical protein
VGKRPAGLFQGLQHVLLVRGWRRVSSMADAAYIGPSGWYRRCYLEHGQRRGGVCCGDDGVDGNDGTDELVAVSNH